MYKCDRGEGGRERVRVRIGINARDGVRATKAIHASEGVRAGYVERACT